jgi:His/Glu/Gln/Arg/opine family amino acid ABC transporter permease subunit
MGFSWHVVVTSFPYLLWGARLTLSASLLAILLGVFVGVALALGRQTGWRPLTTAIRLYISFVRGTPLFVQILVVFYILPAIGLDIPRFQSGVVALSLNSGAYISEMIRGGLSAVPGGQLEAARALGMRRSLIWRRIMLPQVFVLILPPLTMEFTGLLKASSLLMVIGVVELTRTGQQIISTTFRPTEIWLSVGVIYFVMCFALGALTRRIERATLAYRPN